MFRLLFSTLLLLGSTAFAEVKAVRAGAFEAAADSRLYSVKGEGTPLERAEAAGKLIRQDYYRTGYEVRDYAFTPISLADAYAALAVKKSEFPGLNSQELSAIQAWVSSNNVRSVFVMPLESNYQSGTGLEDNYVFVAKNKVLVVRAFWYAE